MTACGGKNKKNNVLYRIFLKRAFDILISVLAIPFVILIAVPVFFFIKLDDGGPVFYKGLRYGKDMRKFYEYKFRSMIVDSPDIRNADGTSFSSENDPRHTRIGRFLRKTSIDELPQFINVLKGDMSIVGPRPSPMGNESAYNDFVRKKFIVRPGITGYNQALLRNMASLEERYRNDVYYAENVSFLLDLKIIFMTVRTVLTHKGVYNTNSTDDESSNAKSDQERIINDR